MITTLRNTRAGQNLVEFALIGPLFFVLVFGIIEGGRLIWTNHTLSNATKEGARYTTVRGTGTTHVGGPATAGAIENHMVDVSTGLNPDELNVSLVLIDDDMNDNSRFRVDSTYEFDFVLTALFGMSSIDLEASSTDFYWSEPDD